jgi:hypothetical protein
MTNIKIYKINGINVYLLTDYNVKNETIDPSIAIDNSIICVLTSWYKSRGVIQIANKNKQYTIVILANSEEEKIYFEKNVECDVIFCNKNAFINENAFHIDRTKPIIYDLVVDSCFCKYKNTNLAIKNENTVHIGYFKSTETVLPLFGTIANYQNEIHTHLDPPKICEIYNKCRVGGIFSFEEGGCLASTQYLLAGLPVVSIKSKGGRDVWYNDRNSILCENNEDDCYRCVQLAKERIINGQFDRDIIRNDTIALMHTFRNKFIGYLIQKIKDAFNVEIEEMNIDLSIF